MKSELLTAQKEIENGRKQLIGLFNKHFNDAIKVSQKPASTDSEIRKALADVIYFGRNSQSETIANAVNKAWSGTNLYNKCDAIAFIANYIQNVSSVISDSVTNHDLSISLSNESSKLMKLSNELNNIQDSKINLYATDEFATSTSGLEPVNDSELDTFLNLVNSFLN